MNFRQIFTLLLTLSELLPFSEPLQATTSPAPMRKPRTITQVSPGYGRDEIPVSERHVGLLRGIPYFIELSKKYSMQGVTIDEMAHEGFPEPLDLLIARLRMLKSGMPMLLEENNRYDDEIKFLEDFHKSLIIAQKKDSEKTDSLSPILPNLWG